MKSLAQFGPTLLKKSGEFLCRNGLEFFPQLISLIFYLLLVGVVFEFRIQENLVPVSTSDKGEIYKSYQFCHNYN